MGRFWPKSRYNGRVMAREIFFYQCLWVTKFCAKFGCSRIPRTASMHNSFIVLRCMWKEPAPLSQNYWLNALGNLPFKLSQLYEYIIKQPNPIINCQLNIIILIEYYRFRIFWPYIINHYVLWMSPIRLLKVKVLKLVLKNFFLVWKLEGRRSGIGMDSIMPGP